MEERSDLKPHNAKFPFVMKWLKRFIATKVGEFKIGISKILMILILFTMWQEQSKCQKKKNQRFWSTTIATVLMSGFWLDLH